MTATWSAKHPRTSFLRDSEILPFVSLLYAQQNRPCPVPGFSCVTALSEHRTAFQATVHWVLDDLAQDWDFDFAQRLLRDSLRSLLRSLAV